MVVKWLAKWRHSCYMYRRCSV